MLNVQKKTFKKFAFSFTLFAIVFLYGEFQYKKNLYFENNIYNLNLQYHSQVESYKVLADFWASKLIQSPEVLNLLEETSNKPLNGRDTQLRINQILIPYHTQIQALELRHLLLNFKDGRRFACIQHDNKDGKQPYNLIPTGKEVHAYKVKHFGYEADSFFGGLRYYYPVFNKNKFIGSFELGVDTRELLNLMDKNVDARYSIAIRRDHFEKIGYLSYEPSYHESFFDKEYIIQNNISDDSEFSFEKLSPLKNKIKDKLHEENSFAVYHLNGLFTSDVYVFIAVFDYEKKRVGYLISKRSDSFINRIYAEQFLKFISYLIALYILWIFYRKQLRSNLLLDQYKAAVDETTLVSKTDTKGRITYVNKFFETLSGYSAKELIGQPNNIVRHPDMPAFVFKVLWTTISNGKTWHGKIKNRKKDGSSYTVDATIFPIIDDEGQIVEYIAIRHDITKLEELKMLLENKLHTSDQSLEESMHLLSQYEKAIEQSASYTRTDPEGIITYLNKTHEQLTGFTNKELIGNTHKLMRDPTTPDSFYKELWDSITQQRIWKGIIKNRNKENEFFFLDTTIIPILDRSGATIEYMSIQYDVTEMLLLQEEIADTQREVIYLMGEITETRSKETGNHVKRVAEYSKLFALKVGMSEEEANLIYSASPMHDIGKVGIPDSILNKPGKLDNNEWEIMRTHSDIGKNILKSSERPIMKAAAIIAYEHHEKWDGKGYPRGIKGEEIHIYGRITAIADVFDALGSDRIYKKAWELEKILELFRQESGNHFDPTLIDIFFDNLSEFLLIRDNFKD